MTKHSIVTAFLLLFVSAVVYAQNAFAQANTNAATDEQLQQQRAASARETARKAQEDAREQYIQSQQQLQTAVSTNIRERTQVFLVNGIDTAIAHMERLRERIENAERLTIEQQVQFEATLDEEEAWFREQKEAINTTEDADTVRSLAQTIRERRLTNVQKLYRMLGYILTDEMNAAVLRYEEALTTATQHRETLSARGYDVTEIDRLLNDYGEDVNAASLSLQHALAAFDEALGSDTPVDAFHEGKTFLENAGQSLTQARTAMQSCIQAFRTYVTQTLSGTGTVTVSGTGHAVVIGSGTITGTAQSAVVTLTDTADTAVIDINGNGNDQGNGISVYTEVTQYIITGTDISLSILGTDASLTASGTGTIILHGIGTVTIDGETMTLDGNTALTISLLKA